MKYLLFLDLLIPLALTWWRLVDRARALQPQPVAVTIQLQPRLPVPMPPRLAIEAPHPYQRVLAEARRRLAIEAAR